MSFILNLQVVAGGYYLGLPAVWCKWTNREFSEWNVTTGLPCTSESAKYWQLDWTEP
jgi:hypothetical protein